MSYELFVEPDQLVVDQHNGPKTDRDHHDHLPLVVVSNFEDALGRGDVDIEVEGAEPRVNVENYLRPRGLRATEQGQDLQVINADAADAHVDPLLLHDVANASGKSRSSQQDRNDHPRVARAGGALAVLSEVLDALSVAVPALAIRDLLPRLRVDDVTVHRIAAEVALQARVAVSADIVSGASFKGSARDHVVAHLPVLPDIPAIPTRLGTSWPLVPPVALHGRRLLGILSVELARSSTRTRVAVLVFPREDRAVHRVGPSLRRDLVVVPAEMNVLASLIQDGSGEVVP
mmetsp:Transcript_13172/g.24164  ORF Transcript_13172/g.24164 Transcript_13172/m.24164 type:complete len:289 (+) Transcript_13172:1644-2510(+)